MAEKFEQWAVVELFGHQVIAGLVSEQVIGGQGFVRVDVPAVMEAVRRIQPKPIQMFVYERALPMPDDDMEV